MPSTVDRAVPLASLSPQVPCRCGRPDNGLKDAMDGVHLETIP